MFEHAYQSMTYNRATHPLNTVRHSCEANTLVPAFQLCCCLLFYCFLYFRFTKVATTNIHTHTLTYVCVHIPFYCFSRHYFLLLHFILSLQCVFPVLLLFCLRLCSANTINWRVKPTACAAAATTAARWRILYS